MVRIGSVVVSYAGALFWNCGVKWSASNVWQSPVRLGIGKARICEEK